MIYTSHTLRVKPNEEYSKHFFPPGATKVLRETETAVTGSLGR